MSTAERQPVEAGIAGAEVGPGAGWFPRLDSVRAIGALAVLTTHVAFWSGDYVDHGYLGTLLSRLDVGVAIFFALSGFLLARPHFVAAASGRGTTPVTVYLWRRAWRVLPLAALTAVIALALLHDNRGLSLGERIGAVTVTSTYYTPLFPAGLTHYWSLAVELAFYLVLPLVMLACLGRRRSGPLPTARIVGVLLALVALNVWWSLDGAALISTSGSPQEWLPGYLTWFCVGIGLALAHTRLQQGTAGRVVRLLATLGGQPGICWALVLGLMLVAATPLAGPALLVPASPEQRLMKNLLYALVGGLVVLTGVFATTPGYARVMEHPWARRLGLISYGIFCLHLPVMHGVMHVTGWQLFDNSMLGLWSLTLVASVLAAEVAYRLVEEPAQRLSRRAARPRRG